MTYSAAAFIDPIPRRPGWHDVCAKVTWTPRGGEPVTVTGAYLDANDPSGQVFLGCGLEEVAEDLDLWALIGDHVLAVCDLVDTQLNQHPYAELICPEGWARLELIHAARFADGWAAAIDCDERGSALTDVAEQESLTTCEWCGSAGKTRRNTRSGWYRTLCDEHSEGYTDVT